MRRTILVAIVMTTGAVGAGARAQGDEKSDVLAGPRVEVRAAITLLQRESDGTIRRTEVPPEVAAARLLDLPEEVMTRIDDLLHRRRRFLEKFVLNNLELLNKLDTASNAGDELDAALLGIQAASKLSPLTRDGSLYKQVRALLPVEKAARFDEILDEYWDAIVSQQRGGDRGDRRGDDQERETPKRKSRLEIMLGERAASLMREVEAAFQRLERSGALLFAYFFREMELRPEQAGEIRALLDEFVEETKGAPTKQQEERIFFAVMSQLDPRQQTELVKQFRGESGGKPAVNRPSKAKEKGVPSSPQRDTEDTEGERK